MTALSTITISHTPEEGTLVDGDPRPHHQVMKDAGFRYSRNVGWYIRGSRDRLPQTWRIEQAAKGLRDAGFEVTVDIDQTVRPTALVEEDRAERIAARQDALDDKADRKAGEADALLDRAHDLASIIPLGQPPMPGHHSYRRDVSYRAKIDRTYDRGFERLGEAREAERKANASRSNEDRRETAPVTIRRIERLEAEARDIERKLAPCTQSGRKMKPEAAGQSLRCPGCYNHFTVGEDLLFPAHGGRVDAPADWVQRIELRATQIEEDVAYWREHLRTLQEEHGVVLLGPADFAKGDRVYSNGHPATVIRVNKKSLTVECDVMRGIHNTSTYERIRKMEDQNA